MGKHVLCYHFPPLPFSLPQKIKTPRSSLLVPSRHEAHGLLLLKLLLLYRRHFTSQSARARRGARVRRTTLESCWCRRRCYWVAAAAVAATTAATAAAAAAPVEVKHFYFLGKQHSNPGAVAADAAVAVHSSLLAWHVCLPPLLRRLRRVCACVCVRARALHAMLPVVCSVV